MEKIISTNNKSLSMVGYLLIGIAIVLIVNSITQISPTENYIYNNLYLGTFAILVGGMFIIFGKKKKYIIFNENQFSYKISKQTFTEKYTEINLIRTFIDNNNHSKNLMIYFDDNKCLSFSSSFWSEEKLIDAYKEFINRSSEFINKNEISVENNLNW
ncbi:MAG: hypothetical protein FWG85_05895 [Bacteroidetes bacterium]|nr:hypothetical protein [Bacteroidota bacterium]